MAMVGTLLLHLRFCISQPEIAEMPGLLKEWQLVYAQQEGPR